MPRVVVVGSVGAGKTSLAQALAERLHVPYVELDALRYRRQWQEASPEDRVRKVTAILPEPHWIIDGHDEAVRDLVWLRADALVWLDYPLSTSLPRLLRRTTVRLMRRESLTGGARELWSRVLGPRSVVVWAMRSHARRRAHFEALLREPRYRHLCVIRLKRSEPLSALVTRVQDELERRIP